MNGASAWGRSVRGGAVPGTIAGAVSSLALAICGMRGGSAAAPINAVSHWAWGDESLQQSRPTLRHTAVGLATQHAAAIFWAVLYDRLVGHRREARQPLNAILGGIATSATAYVIDYTVTPKRLTPGYEHRLDGRGMFAVYAALALGLALGAMLRDDD